MSGWLVWSFSLGKGGEGEEGPYPLGTRRKAQPASMKQAARMARALCSKRSMGQDGTQRGAGS